MSVSIFVLAYAVGPLRVSCFAEIYFAVLIVEPARSSAPCPKSSDVRSSFKAPTYSSSVRRTSVVRFSRPCGLTYSLSSLQCCLLAGTYIHSIDRVPIPCRVGWICAPCSRRWHHLRFVHSRRTRVSLVSALSDAEIESCLIPMAAA